MPEFNYDFTAPAPAPVTVARPFHQGPAAGPIIDPEGLALRDLHDTDGVPRISTRDVAKRFDKRHRDVIRSVELIISRKPDLAPRNFARGYYTMPETGAQQHEEYLCDRKSFSFLVMTFTGEKAFVWKAAFYDAFERMEAALRERAAPPPAAVDPYAMLLQDPRRLIEVAAHYAQATLVEKAAHAETRILLEDQRTLTAVHADRADHAGRALVVAQERIEADRPFVEAYETLLATNGAIPVTDAANILGAPRGRLFAMMRDRGTDQAPREPWLYVRPSGEPGTDTVAGDKKPFATRLRRGEVRVRPVQRPQTNGGFMLRDQPLVTARGLDRLRVEYPAWEAAQRKASAAPGLFDDPADAA